MPIVFFLLIALVVLAIIGVVWFAAKVMGIPGFWPVAGVGITVLFFWSARGLFKDLFFQIPSGVRWTGAVVLALILAFALIALVRWMIDAPNRRARASAFAAQRRADEAAAAQAAEDRRDALMREAFNPDGTLRKRTPPAASEAPTIPPRITPRPQQPAPGERDLDTDW
ncbi:hypothetical protein [Pseudoclavibacter soli]|uniref:hypothetical protein n=1 Tax=Pseudoclavibacter soli TaxID=452623 RepID=UPI00040A500C|nr:hypothetical protein [Pseudoclavibacter soli]